ncbi:MAG: MFS transporter [Bacillota bacterium]
MAAYLALLRHRSFLALYLGLTLSQLGDGLASIAITWAVWKSTDSPAMVAIALLLQTLPRTLLSFYAGILADRHPPRRVMLAADLVRLLITLAAAVVGWRGALGPWGLVTAGFLLTCASAFFAPARAAVTPRLVAPAELPAANGLMSGTFLAARLLGELLGGFLFTAVGAATLIFLDALTFGVALLAVLQLPSAGTPGRERLSFGAEVRQGLAAVWRTPALRWVVGTFAIGTLLAGGAVGVGKTLLVDQFGVGAGGLGLMSTASGVGVVIGSLLAGRSRLLQLHPARTVMLAWAVEGVLVLLLGFSPSLWVALAAVFGGGVTTAFLNVPAESLIQAHGGPHTGKVYSYWTISIWLGESVSLAAAGWLFGALPVGMVFGLMGLALLLLAVAAQRWVWHLRTPEAPAAPAA